MNELNQTTPTNTSRPTSGHIWAWSIIGILTITLAIAAWYGWLYASTPAQLRMPAAAHYHFRLQIINHGQPVNFAADNFQTPYDKLSCSVDLPTEPIHFHDNLDQFVHIHWQGITGGMLLKQYGWNEIDGSARTLGHRFNQGIFPKPIKTHGNILPERSPADNYYLYTGDQTAHKLKDWQEFLHQDLELFFAGSLSPIPDSTTTTSTTTTTLSTDPNLVLLNHLAGNAVLFVQPEQPTEEQVQKYFNQLIPLPKSTCGG